MLTKSDSSDTINVLHTWGANGLLSRQLSGVDTFYQWNPSGNCAARLISTGTVLNSFAVDGFGATAAGGARDPFCGFGGQWGAYSDTRGTRQDGLTLLGHRLYDHGTGRFLTRDPLGYTGGINLYAYSANDPVNRRDPKGLCTFGINFGLGAMGGAFGAGGGACVDGGIAVDTTGTVAINGDFWGGVAGSGIDVGPSVGGTFSPGNIGNGTTPEDPGVSSSGPITVVDGGYGPITGGISTPVNLGGSSPTARPSRSTATVGWQPEPDSGWAAGAGYSGTTGVNAINFINNIINADGHG